MVPSIRKFDNNLELVNSWILEDNLLLSVYYIAIISRYILKKITLMDKFISYFLTNEFLFTANKDHFKSHNRTQYKSTLA